MKKLSLFVAVMLLPVAISAQVIIGGALDFSAFGGKTVTTTEDFDGITKDPTYFSFGIAPKVGYVINDKWEVGLGINLGYRQEMNYFTATNEEGDTQEALKDYKNSQFKWAIEPYARYCLVDVNGFGVWIEGLVSLGSYTPGKTTYYAVEYDDIEYRSESDAKKANKKNPDYKYSCFDGGFYVQPVLTYAINDNWRFESTLNFMGLNISGSTKKESMDKGDSWTKSSDFDFGLSVLKGDYLTVGFVYSF